MATLIKENVASIKKNRMSNIIEYFNNELLE